MTTATPAAIPIYGDSESFYVPDFRVSIEGREVPTTVVRDVTQVTYRDNVDEIDSFELTINNWDAERRAFRYEPRPAADGAPLFEPGMRLELQMGYLRNLRLMVRGEITTLEPSYPESGAPSLAVRGLNRLHAFRKRQHTWGWEGIRDSDLAAEIARQPESEGRPGLGLGPNGIRLDPGYAGREAPETFIFMNNKHDIVLLLERAARRGYELYLELDPATGRERLYFGPSEGQRQVTYRLEWGRSLLSFRPTLTTANQVAEVLVRGWDRRTRRPIEGRASIDDREIELNRDQRAVAAAVRGRTEIVTLPVHSVDEARRQARDILRGRRQELIKAAGATVGLPDLRAGRTVEIAGLGPRFDGAYFVTDTTHTLNDSGYRTTFNARRERELSAQEQARLA